MWRTLPSATSSASAPTVSSIGRVRVDAVLVVQVDVVGAEPLQRAFDGGADVRRAAVEVPAPPPAWEIEPELRGEHDLVAAALDGPADELLVGVRAVDLGGVDEGDAEVEGAVDGADRLGVVAAGAGVGGGHAHRAEADAADIEGAQGDVLHDKPPSCTASE